MACFSQDRDEVVLVFAEARGPLSYYKPFYLKATLRPDFSGLFFPESVHRARTNSVDLFTELTEIDPELAGDTAAPAANRPGRLVTGVRSFLNERCLAISLDDDLTLVFKFFGNRPNLLAFSGNTVADVFNHRLEADWQLRLDQFDRPIDQSYAAYVQAGYDHRPLFPTFGKLVNEWVSSRRDPATPDQWPLIEQTLNQLEAGQYYITRWQHQPALSLLPVGDIQRETTDPLEAANRFYVGFNGLDVFDREKGNWLRVLEKRRKRAEALIEANMQRLMARESGVGHEQLGHILMANLHDIVPQAGMLSPERVTLYDFYRDQPVTIKLKPELSPQRNAENFYRKAKNEAIEEQYLTDQVAGREAELVQLAQQRMAIEATQSLKELRKLVKQLGLTDAKGGNEDEAQLFKELTVDGFRILIGRNARNNDLLTQRHAYKEDLWLHARDVAGSHVLIKHRAGKPFPRNVIERAAELAAWYSKRRTDSLCPVTVTPKKFVRKPKGLAEGQVIVEKESVVMVVPRGE
ncbi:NFACT RNA binding domain-containing protein [Spirosoma luteolum]